MATKTVMIDGKEMIRIWDNYKEIADIQKTNATMVRLAITSRDGVKYISLREFYLKKSTNEWKPSLSKMVIPVDIPLKEGGSLTPLKTLIEVIEATAGKINDLPIYDEEHVLYVEKKEKKQK